jgi:hypothetical protein
MNNKKEQFKPNPINKFALLDLDGDDNIDKIEDYRPAKSKKKRSKNIEINDNITIPSTIIDSPATIIDSPATSQDSPATNQATNQATILNNQATNQDTTQSTQSATQSTVQSNQVNTWANMAKNAPVQTKAPVQSKAPVQPKVNSNIEDDMFKQYFGKKTYKSNERNNNYTPNHNHNNNYNNHNNNYNNNNNNNNNNYNNHNNHNNHNNNYNNHNNNYNNNKNDYNNQTDDDGFKQVTGKRKEKYVVECNFQEITDDLGSMNMPNFYRVLGHHNDDQNWDYISYQNITTLTKWDDIPKFFNTLGDAGGESKYTDFDIFIMKNDISPMWEDIENRSGSICSIKVDSLKDGYNLLKQLLIYSANNTLMNFSLESWDKINGLSFSPKKMDNLESDSSYCVIIKIWFKNNYGNSSSIDKYMNEEINKMLKRYSIKVKSIKPEY